MIKKVILILVITLFSNIILSQNLVNQTDSSFLKLKEFPNNTQFSIALIKDSVFQFIGFIKKNDTLKIIDNRDSLFEIGSLTKVFTATLLANSVLDYKINLNQPINKFLPFQLNKKSKVSFIELANHSSGISRVPSDFINSASQNFSNPYLNYTQEMFTNYLKHDLIIPKKEHDFSYSYSNLGFAILGYSISEVEKMSFDQLLQTKVFDKFQMTKSYTNHVNNIKVVNGLDQKGVKTSFWNFNSSLECAGSIISNSKDLSRFIMAQMIEKNPELELTQKPTFVVSENLSIGLGWHIITNKPNEKIYWHNGATGGFTSSIAFDKLSKKGVIILSNISFLYLNSKLIDELTFELLEKIKN